MTRLRRGIAAQALVALCLVGLLPSCFVFDSRWGEKKRSQRALMQHSAPASLAPTGDGASNSANAAPRSARVLKVRAHATPRHAAEVTDWRHELGDTIDDANRVLTPALGVRLELVDASLWKPAHPDEDLDGISKELASMDPGADIDEVIGLLASVPRYEISFHALGYGQVLGKHFVIRTMNDAREYEGIRRELSELEPRERSDLYRARRRHKATTIVLHELAHNLGVPHERDAKSIMAPRYNAGIRGFSPEALAVIRITLDHRTARGGLDDPGAARAIVDHLRKTSASWVDADRDELVASLEPYASATPPPSPRPSSPPGLSLTVRDLVAPPPPAPLAGADQALMDRATAQQRAGRLKEAWDGAQPLFLKYPDSYGVQDLRCNLAMRLSLPWDEVQAACERLLKLTPGAAPAP